MTQNVSAEEIPLHSSQGLTSRQVQERISNGLTNAVEDHHTKSVKQIIFSNIFTYFNLIFAILAVLLIIIRAWKHLTFLPVVIANMIIGIIQQLYSKSVLDQLSLLDVTTYQAYRDGKETEVSSDALVKDDLIILKSGQQIPADAIVMQGEIHVNESLLTGESDEIAKTTGASLLSGSVVVSGKCLAQLVRVGSESYAAQLTAQAKQVQEKPADMVHDIDLIIRIAGIAIIPVGIGLLVQGLQNGASFADAVISMVAAVVGMIPEGMQLLATVAFAMSAARLANKKVLLHDMKSIETLARVDVLCVDKTGTITSNEMKVTEIWSPSNSIEQGKQMLSRYIQTVQDDNITMRALRSRFPDGNTLPAEEVLSFSSKNKYSMVRTAAHVYQLGAPEYVLHAADQDLSSSYIKERAEKGERVLAFTQDHTLLLLISIRNEIRKSARETFDYFEKQKVAIKVISGDYPLTVSRIAKRAGIAGADKYVDATALKTEEDYARAVETYTVFGRVKPEQKKQLVQALKKQHHKVAMTGDGVNDILAMKEADCSIAMGTGSDAARQAAQVVLLDSDFSHMQDIVSEGRRDVNNITRSATLFLYKNIFSLLLAIFSIINQFAYPLQPNQISLISMFNIGVPAFLLALEDNQVRQNGRFIKVTMFRALPAALTSFFAIAFMVIFAGLFQISDADVATASTYLLSVIGFLILWNISRPANWYHIVVFLFCIFGMLFSATQLSELFSLRSLSVKGACLCILFVLAEITVMQWLTMLSDWIWKKIGKN